MAKRNRTNPVQFYLSDDAEQYKENRSYHIAYKKAKNPDAYFRRYESQIILYSGARRVLEQSGIKLKGIECG